MNPSTDRIRSADVHDSDRGPSICPPRTNLSRNLSPGRGVPLNPTANASGVCADLADPPVREASIRVLLRHVTPNPSRGEDAPTKPDVDPAQRYSVRRTDRAAPPTRDGSSLEAGPGRPPNLSRAEAYP